MRVKHHHHQQNDHHTLPMIDNELERIYPTSILFGKLSNHTQILFLPIVTETDHLVHLQITTENEGDTKQKYPNSDHTANTYNKASWNQANTIIESIQQEELYIDFLERTSTHITLNI
jgi:hypothetical protein